MLLLIVLTFGIAYLLAKKYFNDKKYADFYTISGPKPLPLIGNALMFNKSATEIFTLQEELAKEYNHFFRLTMGTEKIVVLSDPEYAEPIFRSSTNIEKGPSYWLFSNYLRNGLITSSGMHWQKHRKVISPTFHFKALENYSTFMTKNLKIFLKMLEKETSKVVNINPLVNLFTLDSICESAMRLQIDAQLNSHPIFVKALKAYLIIHMKRLFSIFLRVPIIFKISRWEMEQMKFVNEMKTFTASVIASRKKERLENKDQMPKVDADDEEKQSRSFLDIVLDQQDVEKTFDDEEVEDEVNTFMFAGHDTVACSISFCLYEIAAHRDIQERLVEESWDVLGNNTNDVEINMAKISSLKYLDIVIKECMRVRTTVPFIERLLVEDTVINGKHIPKGTTIQISLHSIHQNEKYYPDPDKFDPERFSVENCAKRHPYAYVPFSAGPRNCVGFKYGILMTKATVIYVLRNFILKRSEDEALKPKVFNNAILTSETGVNLILEKRK